MEWLQCHVIQKFGTLAQSLLLACMHYDLLCVKGGVRAVEEACA
jgi:hypothetical protein